MRLTRPLSSVFKQTVINASPSYSLLKSIDKLPLRPASLFVTTTPQNIVSLTSQISSLQERFPDLVIISASFDSNLGNSISELWSDEPIEVADYAIDTNSVDSNNWSIKTAKFSITFKNGTRVFLNPSNSTLFYNEQPFHLMIHDSDHPASGKLLQELSIRVPIPFSNRIHKTNLIPLETETLNITRHGGNLIREINKKGAASFLINALKKHSNLENVQIQAFAEITGSDGKKNNYEIIAGGGEWGPRSEALVLEGLTHVPDGATMKLFVTDPRDIAVFTPQKGVYFEAILEEVSYSNEETVLDDVFGFGSTGGFVINGVNHKSPGEVVNFL